MSRKLKCMYSSNFEPPEVILEVDFYRFRGKQICRFCGHSEVSEARRGMNPTQKNALYPMETLPAPETACSGLRCTERRFKIYKNWYWVDLGVLIRVLIRSVFVPSFWFVVTSSKTEIYVLTRKMQSGTPISIFL